MTNRTRGGYLCALAGTTIALGAAAVTQAQTCVSPTDPSTVEAFDPGDPWTINTWTPDRRPVYRLRLYNGSYSTDDFGVTSWWAVAETVDNDSNNVPDAIDNLLDRLDTAYDLGYRRIMLNLPAGHIQNQSKFMMAQYWTMPEWKRDWLESEIPTWLASKSEAVDLGVFVGSRITDIDTGCLNTPLNLCDSGSDFHQYTPCQALTDNLNLRYPDEEVDDDVALMSDQIGPWFSDVGLTSLWFDNVSSVPEEFTRLVNSPEFKDGSGNFVARMGGEAFPFYTSSSQRFPDNTAITSSEFPSGSTLLNVLPWMALDRFLMFNRDMTDTLPTVDHEETEIGIIMQQFYNGLSDDDERTDFIKNLAHAGYVVWADASGSSGSLVAHAYGLTNTCKADLDEDGDVDGADQSILMGNWNQEPALWIDGDLSGDGAVDGADLGLLLAAWGACP